MKFYTITAVSNFLERPAISSYHYAMFHGLAERDRKDSPHQRADWADWASSASPSQLRISRTIRRVPEISMPSTHAVVKGCLAEKLRGFQNIRLVPVVFKRLVDMDWAKGDMSWPLGGYRNPSDVLTTLPDVPEFHQQIGSYFEVQTYRLKDILDRYPSAKGITIEFLTPPLQEAEVVPLSPEMLTDFPIFWWGTPIVNSDVFDILDAHLDRDFFIVREYELP